MVFETLGSYWGLIQLAVSSNEKRFELIRTQLNKIKALEYGKGGEYEIVESSWQAGFPGQERIVTGRVFKGSSNSLGLLLDQSFKKHCDRCCMVYGKERYTFSQVAGGSRGLGGAGRQCGSAPSIARNVIAKWGRPTLSAGCR